jgi:hypothetical protein
MDRHHRVAGGQEPVDDQPADCSIATGSWLGWPWRASLMGVSASPASV